MQSKNYIIKKWGLTAFVINKLTNKMKKIPKAI